tara:strand:+ start:1014 stop:1943 length:930 start_codon:yes stop_codon:yes gene_type:complete
MLPNQQYHIYGHDKILLELINLEKKNKLPNKILLSGKKSIGKSTLAYHFINYVFSKNEDNKYNISNFTVNNNNKSNILVNNNTHPNLFRIFLKEDKKSIEISDIRNLINFTNLSSLGNQKKIVLIDDIEYLNINSVNALLKVIEEPNNNTYFILINNIDRNIKDTLRSRCIEFKLSINRNTIKNIINDIYPNINYDDLSSDFVNFSNSLNFLIDFLTICINEKINFTDVSIEIFLKFVLKNNLYKKKEYKNVDFKNFIEIFFLKKIRKVPNDKIFRLYNYFNFKYQKFKKYNLDMESYFFEFNSKLLHE